MKNLLIYMSCLFGCLAMSLPAAFAECETYRTETACVLVGGAVAKVARIKGIGPVVYVQCCYIDDALRHLSRPMTAEEVEKVMKAGMAAYDKTDCDSAIDTATELGKLKCGGMGPD